MATRKPCGQTKSLRKRLCAHAAYSAPLALSTKPRVLLLCTTLICIWMHYWRAVVLPYAHSVMLF